jgi:hypothetical protein
MSKELELSCLKDELSCNVQHIGMRSNTFWKLVSQVYNAVSL